ncbi:hypothetical protein [Lederbergia galactosidilytica]|uniref:Uncharacterized protein n=1 Tax=Lederbergia galactosidilytica TaxID=217031 RepID=A0A0Q9Y5L3_9BACI|nr:hypothetical protein [Lederbergia galactosidilytica]KRG14194.1 hypothetical protein ACA30_12460 [Virgibacillus soli]KRG16245.1 hypothetical protein ACA29_04905 [Lederbergia galactosidilytica]MBP1916996.1 hypothetical protein [Lederbergia galactosidilytica]OAK67464.1 hypothetical protein ABB05_20235 [Lederbergia galactosidilytica]
MKINRSVFFTIVLILMLVIIFLLYLLISRPIGSVKLYEDLNTATEYKDIEKLIDDEYIDHFSETDFKLLRDIMDKDSPNGINEYSIFEYNDKWILIKKSPGTENNILNIKVLDEDEIKSLSQFLN